MTRTFKPGDRVAVGRGGPRGRVISIGAISVRVERDDGYTALYSPRDLIPLRKKRKVGCVVQFETGLIDYETNVSHDVLTFYGDAFYQQDGWVRLGKKKVRVTIEEILE